MNTDLVIKKLKAHYGLKSDRQLAIFLGISRQALSNAKTRGYLSIKRLHERCPDISMDWLLNDKA